MPPQNSSQSAEMRPVVVGALFFNIIKLQFENLRSGDRYWYQWHMSAADIVEIDNTTLADVIRRNTTIGNEISDNVFSVN